MEKARDLLGKNKSLLDVMARVLIEKETIYTEEVDMIMEGKSVEEIIAFMDENEEKLQQDPFKRKSVLVKEKKVDSTAEEKVEEKTENQSDDDK